MELLKIVFCAPKFDEATEYSFAWCQEVISYASSKGHEVEALNIAEAVRENVEQKLSDAYWKSAIFVHYNHGSEDKIWGNDDRPVIDLDNNSLLKDRQVYCMNCLSAKTLGADSYHRYGTIYWGSWEVISFTTDALEEFGRAMNYGIKMRLDGEADWNIIMDKTVENDSEIIDELIGKGKVFAASLLREDRNARRVWTDKTPPPPQNSNCFFRKLALMLFGQSGWRIPNPLYDVSKI